MLIEKIKEDRNRFRSTKDSIKENILKLIESESSKINKNPEDSEVFKVLNSIYQSNYETLELIRDDKNRVDETIKLVIENDLINSYFSVKTQTVVNSINEILENLGKETEDFKTDKKLLGIIMKSLKDNFGEGYNKLEIKKLLGI